MQSGRIDFAMTTSSRYTDVSVIFENDFTDTPTVLLTPAAEGTNSNWSDVTFMVKTVNNSGFTARALAKNAVDFNPRINWVALA